MDELKAGIDLDALVAEKVMGVPSAMEPGIDQSEYERRRKRSYPEYSCDIAAVWVVVEGMRGLGWRLELFSHVGWGACFWKRGVNEHKAHEGGDTAPEAICLAAIRAVGS